VTRDQLRALELTDTAIARRVHAGRLHRVRRAVYAVGHPALGAHGLWLAAVLAHGPGALLSHPSAAALWELRPAGTTETHVTVADPGGADRRASGSSRRPHRYRGDRHAPRDPGDQPGAILDLPAGLSPRALERQIGFGWWTARSACSRSAAGTGSGARWSTSASPASRSIDGQLQTVAATIAAALSARVPRA
jgi:hypothetical protein